MAITTTAPDTTSQSLLEQIDTGVLLRIHAGAFFGPQIYYKIWSFRGITQFLEMAGFYPAPVWVVLAGVVETLVAIGLVFNIGAKYAALAAIGVLAVAAGAVVRVRGLGWLFNHGGIEYHVFWLLICFYVFVNEWQKRPGLLPRAS
ncbi:MAG TPA: DoxX family protein [Novosphingobium sp.]|nr:DoxX family protein [Novosphingobium sp.]